MKKFKLEVENAIYFQKEGIDCIEFLRKYGIHDNEFRVYSSKVELTFSEKEVLESTLLKKIFKESNDVTLECELGHFNEMCDIPKTYKLQPSGCKTPVQKDMSESKIIFYKKVNEEIEEIKEVMKWVGEWNPKIRTNSSPYRIRSPFLIENIKKIGEGIKIKGFDLYKLTHAGIDKKITEEEKEKILEEFREFLDTLKFDIEKMKEVMKEEEKEEIKELEKEKEKLLKEIEELEETKEELQEEIKELEKRERNIYYPIYTPSQLKGVLRKLGMQG